jgi:hypothetical protein
MKRMKDMKEPLDFLYELHVLHGELSWLCSAHGF